MMRWSSPASVWTTSTLQRGGSAGSSLDRVSPVKLGCLQCNIALTFIAFAQGAECSWCNVRFCSAVRRHKHEERCARKLGAHARALCCLHLLMCRHRERQRMSCAGSNDTARPALPGAALRLRTLCRVSKFWMISPSAVRAATRHGWSCAAGFDVRCAIVVIGME